ncbi:YsnF/AvaK domain-containing protein [Rufibacter radiotolerans]|uniref:YsnF/AvaK domain-containing protein n=1 Tax=Rufibacter radiotolerans TaxID=1379910 RepID=UPI0009715132|nr:YsnF/AvaK domain-containing protein [Rufibacter radiotolerans]
MAQTVIGIFDNSAEAQKAVQELKSLGISNDRIDVSSAKAGSSASTTGSSSSYTGTSNSHLGDTPNESLAHDATDNDGISGFFKSLFSDDDYSARAYSNVARTSDCVVTVHAHSQEEAQRAGQILDQYGSVDLDQRATEYGFSRDNATGTQAIPIIQENLEVGKREVETGGARLRSRIVERPVEEHLRLKSEHVRVERNAVNRPATEADFNRFQEGDIELTERAEVPVVNKYARVVEEVSLGKEVHERDEVIRDTVRSTEVDVDNLNKDRTRLDSDRTNDLNKDNDRDRLDLDNDRTTRI